METLYPIFYGTRLVTFDILKATFSPRMHPECWRRLENFLLHQGGKFGIGGGWRLTNPTKPGFAPDGMSFHQSQEFPSGLYYSAVDLVVVNPGYPHRAPLWSEVPAQGTQLALDYGVHCNVGTPGQAGSESWHMQPVEIDGYVRWVFAKKPDLQPNYPIRLGSPRPQPPQPPTNPNPIETKAIMAQFATRTLKEGCVGPDVKWLQKVLNDVAGQGLLLDGDFGPRTTQAVKNWQSFFKETSDGKPLVADGIAGALTQQSMVEVSMAVG